MVLAAHRVFETMGTVATVDVSDDVAPAVADRAIDTLIAELERLEEMFSTYRWSSEISRINRGDLDVARSSPEVRDVLVACAWLESDSGGTFRIHPPEAPDSIDPSGYVKGWATERAATLLSAAGLRNWCVNVGGDLVASGRPEPSRPWRAAVRDPNDPLAVAIVIDVDHCAVATSATYERGDHIWRAPIVAQSEPIASITVVGPRLAWVDAFATAAFVMGRDGVEWVAQHDGYDALAITHGGEYWASSEFERLIVND
ncbi:MAG: FAD:protein FMN transferase [Acidimicrobiales bacterium]